MLYHVHTRQGNGSFATLWQDALPSLVASAAAFQKCPKHIAKLKNLVQVWQQRNHFTPDVIIKVEQALAGQQPTTETSTQAIGIPKISKDAPYTLPQFHGDPSTPWYDLPVSTWLPHLTPNSTKPMLPDLIKPIQLAAGPADKTLISAVQALLSKADRLYSKDPNATSSLEDVNELGERVTLDEITGEVLDGLTYYGWSHQFCERMKRRAKSKSGRSRSRSSSHSRASSRSYSPSRKRRRSRSRSASHNPDSRNSSRGRNRSRTPDRNRKRPRSYSRSRSPSQTRLGDPSRFPPPPPPPPVGIGGFPGGFPPPPPPGNYQGQWPPPPPPPPPGILPPNNGGPPAAWKPDPSMMSQWVASSWGAGSDGMPHPPPPPPPPQGRHQPNYGGSGRGNGGGRGRGWGYDRGRGR